MCVFSKTVVVIPSHQHKENLPSEDFQSRKIKEWKLDNHINVYVNVALVLKEFNIRNIET